MIARGAWGGFRRDGLVGDTHWQPPAELRVVFGV